VHARALERDPRVQVIVASPRERLAEVIALLCEGVSDVLVEPLDPALVAAAVRRAIGRRRAEDEPPPLADVSRAPTPARLAGAVAHDIANRVAVVTSGLAAIERALDVGKELEALLGEGADASAIATWWQVQGRPALADAREATQEVTEATDRLKHLSRDLRTVVRAEAAADAAFDAAAAIQTAVRLARPALAPVARLSAEVPAGAAAHGNPGALARAALELLLRSAEAFASASTRGGHVALRWRTEPGFCVLEVEDDAPASAAPEAPRASGVAIARALAEAHGGELVRRSGGRGTGNVFELRLRAPGARP
jgi:signal transduction histidine kinase